MLKKYSQYQDQRFKIESLETLKKDFINEALNNYQQELLINPALDNSNSTHQIKELLISSTSIETPRTPEQTPEQKPEEDHVSDNSETQPLTISKSETITDQKHDQLKPENKISL